MGTVTRRVQVAIGGTNLNLIGDAPERFVGPTGARVQLFGVSSVDLALIGLRIGQSIKMSPNAVGVEAAAGRGPLVPEDSVAEGVGLPFEEILIEGQNGNAALSFLHVKVVITPLPPRRRRRR